jgi:hypothetical protein
MDAYDVLLDGLDRIAQGVAALTDGDPDLQRRPAPTANTPAWLLWHLTRVQDDHVADAFGLTQLWDQGWRERFALPYEDPHETGYAMSTENAGRLVAPAALLADYYAAVHAQTVTALKSSPDLDRVVDTRWDPPVTLGVRLVSVIDDCAQHIGQAAYVLGL